MANHIKNAVVAKTTAATPITFLKIKLRQQTRFSLHS